MDQHGALHSDLHALVRFDQRGHELVAGADYDSAGQHDRAGSDSAELSSRHEVWNSLPGFRARRLRNLWLESSCLDARNRRVWLVWDSGVDWRRSAVHSAEPDSRI